MYGTVRHGQRGAYPSPREGDSSVVRVGKCQSTSYSSSSRNANHLDELVVLLLAGRLMAVSKTAFLYGAAWCGCCVLGTPALWSQSLEWTLSSGGLERLHWQWSVDSQHPCSADSHANSGFFFFLWFVFSYCRSTNFLGPIRVTAVKA